MGFLYCVIYAAGIGFLSFLIGRILPGSLFHEDRFPYKCWNWEKSGAVYDQVLHIKKWQAKVPDMSRILPCFIPPKKVTMDFKSQLPAMIKETCIAEFIHFLLCILSLPCLLIWPGPGGLLFVLLYILGNIPFILIQRYNRPRFLKLQNKIRSNGKEH